MSNPWLKKNPFMSMWLSAAHRIAAPLRAQATAQAKRQVSTALSQASAENLKVWGQWMAPPAPKAKRSRKRRV